MDPNFENHPCNCTYACMYVCMCACMHACMYVCMHICTCVCVLPIALNPKPSSAQDSSLIFRSCSGRGPKAAVDLYPAMLPVCNGMFLMECAGNVP